MTMEEKKPSNTKREAVTAAEFVRRQQKRKKRKLPSRSEEPYLKTSAKVTTSVEAEPFVDIDKEIARLEAELARDDEDETVSHSSNDDRVLKAKHEEKISGDASSDGIVCLSSLKNERIESLPEQYLPQAPKTRSATGKQRKKSNDDQCSGLEKAVKEVLSGYVPRSSERIPFYCRVCQKQYSNEKEFFEHRTSEFHVAAAEAERKASYCKLCRKQLTSPAQLQEHLKSKPHKERLQRLSSSNPRNRRRPYTSGSCTPSK